MNQILKEEWQWDGVVISDWGAVHDTHTAIIEDWIWSSEVGQMV